MSDQRKPRPLVAGNWKMNGLRASAAELTALLDLVRKNGERTCEILVCPPATLLAPFAPMLQGSTVQLGAQDCHAAASGAHTGDISAEMLADIGCHYVIVGHSERRTDHGETDETVRDKASAAKRAGIIAIICVGETEAERDRGDTLAIVGRQIDRSIPSDFGESDFVVAYEPVWAIGTGRTPSVEDVAEAHAFIRRRIVERLGKPAAAARLLYGGSVKPSNAKELMSVENVDGALVGGASLKASDFWGIIGAYA